MSRLLAEPGSRSISVHYVLASNDALQTLPWNVGLSDDSGGTRQARWDMRLTPHVTGPSPAVVRLEVAFVSADGDTASSATTPVAQTTVALRDQQTIVLAGVGTPSPARTIFAVTPYVVWSDADVRRLLECKLAARHASNP